MKKQQTTLIFLIFLISITIFSENEIMQLSEIKNGMSGTGYTVVQGKSISKFKFEVLNIIPGEKSINKMILAKFYDGAIKASGGISEGMSGSPLYINGKLIGALSYVADSGAKNIGLVTPIEEIRKLENHYNKNNLDKKNNDIIPGMAIAISPVHGDINLDSIGTLTYVDGNSFCALGHPFDRIGRTHLFIKKADILYSIPSSENSFKLGKGNEIFGLVLEDRDSGIAGIISNEIETYKFNLEINIGNQVKKVFFEMPKDINIIKNYLGKSIELGLDKVTNSNEYYTSSYDYTLYDNESNRIYSNSNFLYFENNLIESISLIVTDEIITILDNPFRQITFNDMVLSINLYKNKKIAYLNNLNIAKRVIKLGEDLNLELEYFLYQGLKKRKEIIIKVPIDFTIGNAEVIIKRNKENQIRKSDFKNFEEYNDYYKTMHKNNEIIIEINGKNDHKIIKKVYLDAYLQGEKELKKNIIIDTFEANYEEKIDDSKIR